MSLTLARLDSPARIPILAHISAIDTELARRTDRHPDGLPGLPATLLILADLAQLAAATIAVLFGIVNVTDVLTAKAA